MPSSAVGVGLVPEGLRVEGLGMRVRDGDVEAVTVGSAGITGAAGASGCVATGGFTLIAGGVTAVFTSVGSVFTADFFFGEVDLGFTAC